MIFAVATNNKKKLAEIQRILDDFGYQAKSLQELDIDIDILEDGKTFAENSIIKAKAIAELTGMPTISDDSGLCVDALFGEPGVYTARYAGENATDEQNIEKLLQSLKNTQKEQRTAKFVSAVCLYTPKQEYLVCVGECEGWIGFEKLGEAGFGYDPVFMVGSKSYSQMTDKEKDAISHRGKALRKMQQKIQEYIKDNI